MPELLVKDSRVIRPIENGGLQELCIWTKGMKTLYQNGSDNSKKKISDKLLQWSKKNNPSYKEIYMIEYFCPNTTKKQTGRKEWRKVYYLIGDLNQVFGNQGFNGK